MKPCDNCLGTGVVVTNSMWESGGRYKEPPTIKRCTSCNEYPNDDDAARAVMRAVGKVMRPSAKAEDSTPWPVLELGCKGIEPGQFVVFYGQPKDQLNWRGMLAALQRQATITVDGPSVEELHNRTFAIALTWMGTGKKVRREDWRPERHWKLLNGRIYSSDVGVYKESVEVEDILAEDWEVYLG